MPAKSKNPRAQIRESGVALKVLMQEHLSEIADSLVVKTMSRFERVSESQELISLDTIEPKGVAEYRSVLRTAMAVIAREAIENARREVSKAKNVKFCESLDSVKLDEFSGLPPSVRKRVQVLANLTASNHVSDLKKNISFQYASSVGSTDSAALITADLNEAAEDFITSSAITSGSTTTASQVVNSARSDFLFQDEVLEQIEGFEFVNGDPVSEVCNDLAGIMFAKDDPEAFRYFPPLHFNCKSYIRPILLGNAKASEFGKLRPSSAKIADSIQFSESETIARFNFEMRKLSEFPEQADKWLEIIYSRH